MLVSLFLIISPLRAQTVQGRILHTTNSEFVKIRIVSVNKNTINNQVRERTAIQDQKIKYTMTLANGRFIRGSIFEFINDDSLLLIANNYDYVASLMDIVRISEVGKNKIKKGGIYGAVFFVGYGFLVGGLDSAILGALLGTTIGGVTGAIKHNLPLGQQ